MEKICPPQANLVWYNVRVPYTRDESIFDIDLETEMEDDILFLGHRPEVAGRARCPQRAAAKGLGHTQQRIGFRGKAANFPQRRTGYDGASRDTHAACPLSCFSFRFLAAPSTKRDFEGAPLSFLPRRSDSIQ